MLLKVGMDETWYWGWLGWLKTRCTEISCSMIWFPPAGYHVWFADGQGCRQWMLDDNISVIQAVSRPYPLEQVTSAAVEKLMHDLVDEGEASHVFFLFMGMPKKLCLWAWKVTSYHPGFVDILNPFVNFLVTDLFPYWFLDISELNGSIILLVELAVVFVCISMYK